VCGHCDCQRSLIPKKTKMQPQQWHEAIAA